MGTTRAVTGWGWGQHAANGAGTGWGRGQWYILRGGNGVKHLSPRHSLLGCLLTAFVRYAQTCGNRSSVPVCHCLSKTEA